MFSETLGVSISWDSWESLEVSWDSWDQNQNHDRNGSYDPNGSRSISQSGKWLLQGHLNPQNMLLGPWWHVYIVALHQTLYWLQRQYNTISQVSIILDSGPYIVMGILCAYVSTSLSWPMKFHCKIGFKCTLVPYFIIWPTHCQQNFLMIV